MTTSLVRRGAAYYFRRRVPIDLIDRIGRREVRVSLQTNDYRRARSVLVRMQARTENLFLLFRGNPMLTEADYHFYARWWYQACLDEHWGWKQLAAELPDKAGPINDDLINDRAKDEARILQELNRGDISRVEVHAQLALMEDGRSDDLENDDFPRLCAYMLRAALEANRRTQAEDKGDFGYETRDPLFKPLPEPPKVQPVFAFAAQPAAPYDPKGPSLGDLVEPFINDKGLLAKVASKTLNDYRTTLTLFLQVVGADTPIKAVRGEDVVEFKNLLITCPVNFRKRLGTDSLREAVRLNAERTADRLNTLDPKTINEKYLSNLKSFFDWAKENKLVSVSPAVGVRAQQPRKDAVMERDPFSIADLKCLFSHPRFVDADNRDHRFWAPLIALFTGCRLSEIGQLRVDDIMDLHDIPHFSIRDDAEDQHLKTNASRRWVPVHPELIALGLLDFVQRQGKGRLFPGWSMSADGYLSSSYSTWFSRLLSNAEIKTDKKSFHSFRHNVADALDEVVEAGVRDKFLGHVSGKVRDRYGSKPPKRAWSEAFMRMSYPNLDLSHLYPR